MSFRSGLYVGAVMHRRLRPKVHQFRYRAFWLLIDLDELPALTARLKLFSHNRFNLFALHESDLGDGGPTPLRIQAERLLAEAGIDIAGGIIRLLCMPRTLGYSFNPISLYYCHRPGGELAAIIYEVHNTFGERHRYVAATETKLGEIRQNCRKAFYVSPFMDMDLAYHFRLTEPTERVAVGINASKGGERVLHASLAGRRRELTDGALLKTFLEIPLVTAKVTLAIHWEALRLWLKGLRLRTRPAAPAGNATLAINTSNRIDTHVTESQHTAPGSVDVSRTPASPALLASLMQRMLRRIDCDEILLQTPGGRRLLIGGKRSGERAHVTIHSWKCMLRLLTSGDLGFAEGYLAGEWSTPNIHAFLSAAGVVPTIRHRSKG